MKDILLTAAICFSIGGFQIPIHAPAVLLEDHSYFARLLAGVALMLWGASIGFAVSSFIGHEHIIGQ